MSTEINRGNSYGFNPISLLYINLHILCRSHILLTPGPFTTPRAAYRSVPSSKRSITKKWFAVIVQELQQQGLGKYVKMTAPPKETVYYKPLPSPDVKATLERHLEGATWDNYKTSFKK